MVRAAIISIILLTILNTGQAQTESACLVKLQSLWKSYHELLLDVPKGKVYFLDYSVNTILREETNQAANQNVQVWLTSEMTKVKNEYVEMYSTLDHSVSVYPMDKRINIATLPKGYQKNIRSQYTMAIIDSLFASYAVYSCHKINNGFTEISLKPIGEGLAKFNVRNIKVIVDWDKSAVISLQAKMGPKGNVENFGLRYNALDLDYSGQEKPVDFCKEHLTADNKLTGIYKDYLLIDNRRSGK